MSNKLPIYIVSIMKNELKHIERWYNSFKDEMEPGDMAVLLDTGSEDGSYEFAQSLGITVYKKVYDKWRFDVARNDLREMLPQDDAWVLSLDVDEVLTPGWREHMKAVPMDVNRPRYNYVWNFKEYVYDQDGTVDYKATIDKGAFGVSYHGDKIVRRHSHVWRGIVHEVNHAVKEERQGWTDLQIFHFADNTKSRGSYLPLLLQDVAENPHSDRNTYYCARELFFYGRYEESIAMFKRHLTMPESVWGPERAWSMRYLAKMIPDEAEHWHLRACSEYKEGAETWTDLAKYYYGKEDWFNMFYAAKRALTCQLYKGLYLTEPDAYGWWPNDMAALSAYRLGYFKEALHHGQIAVDLNPTDQRLKDNLIWYKKALAGVTVVIPTKSNVLGLTALIRVLEASEGVSKVVVVGDGIETEPMLKTLPSAIIKTYVPRGAGISKMWNHGMQLANAGDHVLFLNDDVTIDTSTVSGLVSALAEDSRIGLVCPKYAGQSDVDIISHTTCRGRYDGTGGMAGFCMMLAADLVPHFRFDERMIWWYSDDDLVNWVNYTVNRLCVISAKTRCVHGHSVTIRTDPPDNFNDIILKDKQIFNNKWLKEQ